MGLLLGIVVGLGRMDYIERMDYARYTHQTVEAAIDPKLRSDAFLEIHCDRRDKNSDAIQ